MLYRTRRPLETKKRIIPSGCVFRSSEISKSSADRLLELKIIMHATTPPLRVIEGFEDQLKVLARRRIRTVAEFIDAQPEKIADALEITVVEAKHKQNALLDMLATPSARNSG